MKPHQAGFTSEGPDGPRRGTKQVYTVFQLSKVNKAQLPSQQNQYQQFGNETEVKLKMFMRLITHASNE